MTTQTYEAPVGSAPLVSLVADCARELAELAGSGCLVEGAGGRLVAHHVVGSELPPAVVTAVLSGCLAALHEGLADRRTTGLLASSPVVEGRVSDQRVLSVVLRDGEAVTGALWLLGDRVVSLADLQAPVQRLARLLAQTSDAPAQGCLAGGPLPAGVSASDHLWVARVRADASAGELRQALEDSTTPVHLRVLRCGERVYVLAAAHVLCEERVHLALETLRLRAAGRLGLPVTLGVSAQATATELPSARAQADAAASAAREGSTAPLASVRGALVVRQLAASVLPDLGPDPLDAVREYDTRRGSQLADTLLVWLDAFGDVATATAALGIHGNTLRYRLGRINDILGIDLRLDPNARAALHVQLLGSAVRSPA